MVLQSNLIIWWFELCRIHDRIRRWSTCCYCSCRNLLGDWDKIRIWCPLQFVSNHLWSIKWASFDPCLFGIQKSLGFQNSVARQINSSDSSNNILTSKNSAHPSRLQHLSDSCRQHDKPFSHVSLSLAQGNWIGSMPISQWFSPSWPWQNCHRHGCGYTPLHKEEWKHATAGFRIYSLDLQGS